MKLPPISTLLVVLSAVALALTAPAAEKTNASAKAAAKEPAPEWAELFGGASLPLVWKSISAASEKIDAAMAANELGGVAAWAETIHLGSHALDDQVKLEDPERAKRLKGALEQAAKIADDVINAANHKEADQVAEAQRRLKSALALAKIRLPKEVLQATEQAPRFAKPATHPVEHAPKK